MSKLNKQMKAYIFLIIIPILIILTGFKSKEPITIFMIGDSTMADKNTGNENIERGWGQLFSDFLSKGVVVENHAMDGRSSKSFINEGRWDNVLKKIKKGDYVFIQFGHNDEKTAEDLHTIPGGTFDENLRRFVNETRLKGGIPVLFNSIVHRNFPPKGATQNKGSYQTEGDTLIDTHGKYLISPCEVAKELNVPFVDMNKLTHDLIARLGSGRSKDLFMWIHPGVYAFCPDGKIDNTHLNIYEARVVAGIAANEIAKIIPDLSMFLCHYNFLDNIYIARYKEDEPCATSFTSDDHLQKQVISYIKERDYTNLTIENKGNFFKITPRLNLGKNLFSGPLTMVITGSNIKKICARQDNQNLSIKILSDKALFDFDPYGGEIQLNITYNKIKS